jgi:formamidopyrimidine-DNA glycosylase
VPELPDVELYLSCLRRRIGGTRLAGWRLTSSFFLRTVAPRPEEFVGRDVAGLERLGKRIVIGFEGEMYAVLHLMVAGRLRWRPRGAGMPGRIGLAALDFDSGTLLVTEAGSRKRASLHLVRGRVALATYDRGGVDPLAAGPEDFAAALGRENHTLKRALTDPRLFSGIGNAYSDEILHRARLSPLQLTRNLSEMETARLHEATQAVLREWRDRLIAETGDGWPDKVTAFRDGMAVHGRFRQPCPDCGAPVQRIVRADNECNYCARCQTGGRVLADRALSRLLGKDWPRSLDDP